MQSFFRTPQCIPHSEPPLSILVIKAIYFATSEEKAAALRHLSQPMVDVRTILVCTTGTKRCDSQYIHTALYIVS